MTGLERINEQLATLAVVRRAHGHSLDGGMAPRRADKVCPPVALAGTGPLPLDAEDSGEKGSDSFDLF